MPIKAICPNPACARLYSLPESVAGRKTKCKVCGQTFVIGDSATINGSGPPAPAVASRPSPSHTDLQTVGRFVVRGKLGAGAFGTVYRAYDPNLNREVALKIPNPGAMDTPQRVERFLREAKAAANLRHQHIVPVFDAGQDGDRYYIASAFIDGKPLADTIEERGTDFPRAARIVRELAEALAYAHEEGIVHRDVKPQNIMVDQHDRVHLMDFGLASRQEEAARLTNDGAVMGTPAYMSPEQAAGQKGEAKPATDQYAAGVVLYELLTGTVPFKGPLPVVMHNVIHTEPDSPSKVRTYTPKDLETICLKAMAKRPQDRYANCQELADDLRRWQEGEPITARSQGAIERTVRWVARKPTQAGLVALGGVAVALLVFTVAIAGLWFQARTDKARADQARESAESDKRDADAARKNAEIEKKKADEARDAEEAARREAESEKKTAEAEKRNAELARQMAEAEKKKADEARRLEEAARREAETNRDALAEERKKFAQADYRRAIELANLRFRTGDIATANDLLNSTATDVRDRDWWYLHRHINGSHITLKGHTTRVHSVLFNSVGDRILTISADKTARVWDASKGVELYTIKPISKLALSEDKLEVWFGWFSSDGNEIIALDSFGSVQVRQAKDGAKLNTFAISVPVARPKKAILSPNGRQLAVTIKNSIEVWNLAGIKLYDIDIVPKNVINSSDLLHDIAFTADGTKLVTVTTERNETQLRFWNVQSGAEVREMRLQIPQASATSASFSPDGSRLLTRRTNDFSPDSFFLIDNNTGKKVVEFEDLAASGGISFSPNGTRVLTVSKNLTQVRAWDTKDGTELLRLKSAGRIHSATFDPQGVRILTASFDRTIRIWDAKSGVELLTLENLQGTETRGVFSPDGTRFVTFATDGTVKLYNGQPSPTPPAKVTPPALDKNP